MGKKTRFYVAYIRQLMSKQEPLRAIEAWFTYMRTYNDLSDTQLRELSMLLTNGPASGQIPHVDRDLPESDQHILLSDGSGWEVLFSLTTGQVRCYAEDNPVHLRNIFRFVDRCRELGLTY